MAKASTKSRSASSKGTTGRKTKASATGLPPEEVLACNDGLVENDNYGDMRGASAETFCVCYVTEGMLLDLDGDEEEVERWDELISQHSLEWPFYTSVDLGMRSAVTAISLVGAAPYTSCNGQEGHCESYPLVAFWTEEGPFALIKASAKKAKLSLEPAHEGGDYPSGYVLSGPPDSLPQFRAFASDLYSAWTSSRRSAR